MINKERDFANFLFNSIKLKNPINKHIIESRKNYSPIDKNIKSKQVLTKLFLKYDIIYSNIVDHNLWSN